MSSRWKCAAAIAGAGVAVLLTAMTPWPAWASPPERVEVRHDNVHVRTLDNGLDVAVVSSHAVPIVTIEIAVRNGAFTEPPELNGLSHLYEHMFFKANESIPSQEAYLARQRELGMIFNGTTSTERVNYYFTLQSPQLREGLEFMAAAIRTPVFEPDELVREREVVLGEYDRNEASPYYYLWDRMSDLLWYAHPSRKDSLGDRETISTATVEQMRAMQRRYYVPNNSLLIIAGDVTPEYGFALAEDLFGDWEQGADPFLDAPVPEHPPLTSDVASIVEQPVGMSVLQIGWHGPDTRTDIEATWAADVFSFILTQEGSGFRQRLVESGILLDVGFSYQTQRYVGPITLTAAVAPGREREALAAIGEELSRFASPDYFTDEQVRTAQTLLAVSEVFASQDVETIARTLSYWWCSASIDYYLNYVDQLYAVERPAIAAFVERYIVGAPKALVLMTSAETVAAAGITESELLEAIRW